MDANLMVTSPFKKFLSVKVPHFKTIKTNIYRCPIIYLRDLFTEKRRFSFSISWCDREIRSKAQGRRSFENLVRLMLLSKLGKVTENVLNRHLEIDSRIWIALPNYLVIMLQLLQEFILHVAPYNLQQR